MDDKCKELGDGILDLFDGRLSKYDDFEEEDGVCVHCGGDAFAEVGTKIWCEQCVCYGLEYGDIIETKDGYVEID